MKLIKKRILSIVVISLLCFLIYVFDLLMKIQSIEFVDTSIIIFFVITILGLTIANCFYAICQKLIEIEKKISNSGVDVG